MGDFSGDPTAPLRPLTERKFVQIDRDNFNEVMASMTPGLKLKVDNTLANDGTQMAVDLKFNSMDDFEPARVAAQVPALAALLETRAKLRDLMSKVDRSEELENLLEQVLRSQLRRRVIRAVLALPAIYRAPVVLRDLQGMSTEEASAVLKVKDQTLKSRLHRGRLILRKQLADFAGGLTLHRPIYGT
jgi:type VI secretion system protein ImpB